MALLVLTGAAGEAGTLTTVAFSAGALPGLAGTAGTAGAAGTGVLALLAVGCAVGTAVVTTVLTGTLLLLVPLVFEVIFPTLLVMVPILGCMVALVEVRLTEMGFRFPSTCSPTRRLDSPASFTTKTKPLGAVSSSCSSLASKVRAALPFKAGAGAEVVGTGETASGAFVVMTVGAAGARVATGAVVGAAGTVGAEGASGA